MVPGHKQTLITLAGTKDSHFVAALRTLPFDTRIQVLRDMLITHARSPVVLQLLIQAAEDLVFGTHVTSDGRVLLEIFKDSEYAELSTRARVERANEALRVITHDPSFLSHDEAASILLEEILGWCYATHDESLSDELFLKVVSDSVLERTTRKVIDRVLRVSTPADTPLLRIYRHLDMIPKLVKPATQRIMLQAYIPALLRDVNANSIIAMLHCHRSLKGFGVEESGVVVASLEVMASERQRVQAWLDVFRTTHTLQSGLRYLSWECTVIGKNTLDARICVGAESGETLQRVWRYETIELIELMRMGLSSRVFDIGITLDAVVDGSEEDRHVTAIIKAK